jgi:hypothetical protein
MSICSNEKCGKVIRKDRVEVRSGTASAKLHAWGQSLNTSRGRYGGRAPVEGVAEDQTEGDVAAPQVQAFRPECSVRSEGETSPFWTCLGDKSKPRISVFYKLTLDNMLR